MFEGRLVYPVALDTGILPCWRWEGVLLLFGIVLYNWDLTTSISRHFIISNHSRNLIDVMWIALAIELIMVASLIVQVVIQVVVQLVVHRMSSHQRLWL